MRRALITVLALVMMLARSLWGCGMLLLVLALLGLLTGCGGGDEPPPADDPMVTIPTPPASGTKA